MKYLLIATAVADMPHADHCDETVERKRKQPNSNFFFLLASIKKRYSLVLVLPARNVSAAVWRFHFLIVCRCSPHVVKGLCGTFLFSTSFISVLPKCGRNVFFSCCGYEISNWTSSKLSVWMQFSFIFFSLLIVTRQKRDFSCWSYLLQKMRWTNCAN